MITSTARNTEASTETTWGSETEQKNVFLPTGKVTSTGKPKLRRVTIRYIILTHAKFGQIRFTVTHITRNGFRSTTICDHREEEYGWHGTGGAFGTREYAKAGKAKSYTPSSWVEEVTRFIGHQRAIELLVESDYDFTTRTI